MGCSSIKFLRQLNTGNSERSPAKKSKTRVNDLLLPTYIDVTRKDLERNDKT